MLNIINQIAAERAILPNKGAQVETCHRTRETTSAKSSSSIDVNPLALPPLMLTPFPRSIRYTIKHMKRSFL